MTPADAALTWADRPSLRYLPCCRVSFRRIAANGRHRARSGSRPETMLRSAVMLYYLVATLYVLACFLLLLVVLLQQGKGGDIASAFGGGGSQTAFGARAGATVLTRATAVLGAVFMVGAVLLAVLGRPGSGSLLRGTAAPAPPPVQTPLANPATNPVQPATTPQQQPTALPQRAAPSRRSRVSQGRRRNRPGTRSKGSRRRVRISRCGEKIFARLLLQ